MGIIAKVFGTHLFDRKKFEIYDCTNLTSDDVREVYARIPRDVRIEPIRVRQITLNKPMSFSEFMPSNVRDPQIWKRFASALEKLSHEDAELHDLLLAFCYVHACGVPSSYELAYSLLGGGQTNGLGYKEVFVRISDLGKLLVELESGDDFGLSDNQDYYMARSTYLAERVLENVPTPAFRRMYEKFVIAHPFWAQGCGVGTRMGGIALR